MGGEEFYDDDNHRILLAKDSVIYRTSLDGKKRKE